MRVVIVEDQALLREGLARLFTYGGHDVVGTLSTANQVQQIWPVVRIATSSTLARTIRPSEIRLWSRQLGPPRAS